MDDIRATLKRMRDAVKLYEATQQNSQEDTTQQHPYTEQDELMKTALERCKTQFGANFSKNSSPMIYYPQDGDVTISGEVPELNNAKFQFRYREPSGNGVFLWVNNLIITDDTISKLSKMLGVYKNWRQELSTSEDIKPMDMRNKEL
jgi:hypothetical protein